MKQIFIGGLNHNYIRPPAVIFRRFNWMDEADFPAAMQKLILRPIELDSLLTQFKTSCFSWI
jgi:hypothetical protein